MRMLSYLLVASFTFFSLQGCRSTRSDLSSEEIILDASNAPEDIVNDDFDWIAHEENGQQVPRRHLTYCYDKSVSPIIREAFEAAVKKINDATNADPQLQWRLSLAGTCKTDVYDKNGRIIEQGWNLRSKDLRTPNLRIMEEYLPRSVFSSDAESSSKPMINEENPLEDYAYDETDAAILVPYGPYRIDHLMTEEIKKGQWPLEVPHKHRGLYPTLPAQAYAQFAQFEYEHLYGNHNYILTGQIKFTPLKNPTDENDRFWSSEMGTSFKVDPNIVALHMLLHALRLKHDYATDDHHQEIPCGSKTYIAEADESTPVLSAEVQSKLDIKPKGDDRLIEDGAVISVGPNRIADTTKSVSMLYPYIRLDEHCRNPSALTSIDARMNLTPRDLMALKAAATKTLPAP